MLAYVATSSSGFLLLYTPPTFLPPLFRYRQRRSQCPHDEGTPLLAAILIYVQVFDPCLASGGLTANAWTPRQEHVYKAFNYTAAAFSAFTATIVAIKVQATVPSGFIVAMGIVNAVAHGLGLIADLIVTVGHA